MIGNQDRWQEDLFVACPLRDLIPDDHILKQVDEVLDLSWLRDEVRELYDEQTGRPSIDPEAAVRLMLAGFFHNIVHDRKLMREAQVNLAIRWFAGYRLHEALPHHSSLTRIRQRWGAMKFKRIFERTVQSCAQGGLVNGETVHVDATLIRADVSWKSLSRQHAERVVTENDTGDDSNADGPGSAKRGRPRSKPAKPKKRSRTDPDATLCTNDKRVRMQPCYKQHTAVDDHSGVIIDVDVTTGETSEGVQLPEQIDRIESTTGKKIKTLTADSGYAHAKNYAELEKREIEGIIPPQPEVDRKCLPARRFRYDRRHDLVRCPRGKKLRASSPGQEVTYYRARVKDCRGCPLRQRCFSPKASVRTILLVDGYEALLRARRRRSRSDERTKGIYKRHFWRAEGINGEAKTQHGLRRAVRRRLDNVAIQSYMTAAVINLKRLAALLCAYIAQWAHSMSTQGGLGDASRQIAKFTRRVDVKPAITLRLT